MKAPPDIDYQLRIAAEEIEAMRGEIRVGNLPHIKAILDRPRTRWILARLQEFIWTVEHLSRRRPEPLPTRRPKAPRPALTQAKPSVWFDVTNSYRSGFKGGIARVAMKLAESAAHTGEALPVVMKDGDLFSYFDVECSGRPLQIDSDTIFVIIDTFWKPFDEYLAMLDTVHRNGGRAMICIHDVIALDYPIFFDMKFASDFRARLSALLGKVEAGVTVSRYTLDMVRAHFGDEGGLPMASFRLGADLDAGDGASASRDGTAVDPIRSSIRQALSSQNVFVSVGTLEPRKGYTISLDAFDRLWAEGASCALIIFGQPGWICNALERRLLEHPEYRRRLHWFVDASDAELAFAYRAAYCLIQASVVEGFGLPIVEACREGTPVIASDAAIFREVGQDRLVYFRSCDSGDLRSKIADVIRARPVIEPLDVLTWDQSLNELVEKVRTLLPPRDLDTADDIASI